MKFIIKHEIKGRIRISLARKFHTVREADVLEQYLLGLDGVTAAKVYERTADAVIYYKEDREAVLVQVAAFDGQITEKQEMAVKSSGRALNQEYKEKLIQKVLTRFATKTFLPAPVRAVYTSCLRAWSLTRCSSLYVADAVLRYSTKRKIYVA